MPLIARCTPQREDNAALRGGIQAYRGVEEVQARCTVSRPSSCPDAMPTRRKKAYIPLTFESVPSCSCLYAQAHEVRPALCPLSGRQSFIPHSSYLDCLELERLLAFSFSRCELAIPNGLSLARWLLLPAVKHYKLDDASTKSWRRSALDYEYC